MSEPDTLHSTIALGPSSDGPVDLQVAPLEELVGQRRYQLGDVIGRGGMGEIRACRDVTLNRHQVMKLATSSNPAARARFVREARVQGQLEHPSIVPVHELGLLPGGEPYFSMKRVHGVTLEHVLERLAAGDKDTIAKYPRRRLLSAFQSVCLAIHFAHTRRVLHRDLKPANIMLGDFGEVYVLDWGIAKRLDAQGASLEPNAAETQPAEPRGAGAPAVAPAPVPLTVGAPEKNPAASAPTAFSATAQHADAVAPTAATPQAGLAETLDAPRSRPVSPGAPPPSGETPDAQTQAGAVMGTPSYMPPEQINGEPVDERADVFALGSVLFELLTLKKLVSGDTPMEIMQATLAGVGAHARFRAPDRDIPPELEAICVKATANDREQRYWSARALHDDLDWFLAGERDVQMRTGLASKHLVAARAAAAHARVDHGRAAELRATALREVGQALTLDPGNPRAMRTLVSLLGARKGKVPEVARVELARAASHQLRRASLVAAITYGSIFLYLPLLLWMGVREWSLLAVMYGAVLASVGATLAVARARKITDTSALLPLVTSTVMIASLSFVLGPFVFLPSFAATNTAAFALLLPRQYRAFAITIGMMGVLVPIVAEQVGLVPNPMHFTANGLLLLPQMVNLNPMPTILTLAVSALGTIALSAVAVAGLRDALREAEEKLATQAWNLRQLLPPEATAATTGEHPVGDLF